jgi:hypothetical protein
MVTIAITLTHQGFMGFVPSTGETLLLKSDNTSHKADKIVARKSTIAITDGSSLMAIEKKNVATINTSSRCQKYAAFRLDFI